MQGERAPLAALVVALGLFGAALPLAHGASRPRPIPPPRAGAARLLWGLPLDLNREDARTLEVLPGIGPTRARAIRAARPFCRVSDLRRVHGIGPVTLGRLAEQLMVSSPRPISCRD
jgi:hypothetical protein